MTRDAKKVQTVLARAIEAPRALSHAELVSFLACDDEAVWADAFAAAREVKRRCGKTETLPRGLIECSNVCAKDCLYCGIRKSNDRAVRYRLSETEAIACIDEARRRGYPAVAFQAGEIESDANTAYYERLLAASKGLEVTLSLGEQTEAVYRRWKAAGAMRYLLRIETSNRELYGKFHPATCSFDRRVECLRTLKRLGYVTGTGVMIGLPGQTVDDLAADIEFFGEIGADMVGMGPFIPHPETPMSQFQVSGFRFQDENSMASAKDSLLSMAVRMIALVRLYLQDVNIVAATALEALDPARGRERGIAAGANVVMPNVTAPSYRGAYDLYPGKGSV